MIRVVIAIISFVVLASCAAPNAGSGSSSGPATKRVKVPDVLPDLGNDGVLIANIAANAVAGSVYEELWFSMAGVQVDGVYYSNAVRNNYLVLPLSPGEHTFESLHVYRTSDDQSSTRYPLGYKVQIVAGQATNLGVIALVRPKGEEKKYWRVLIDNTSDMTAYLRKSHPKLAASLRPAAPVLASGPEIKYADANSVDALRRDIARDVWATSDEPDTVAYVGGEVGTIARILRDSQGKVAAFDVLDTGTTAPMRSCSSHGERAICSSAEPALYFVNGTKVEKRALPSPAANVWVHTYPPSGLVLMDEYLNIYTSNNNGASWMKSVWYTRKEPLTPKARIKSANGKNGYYLYATFNLDPLAPQVIYSEYARPGFRTVDIPKLSSFQRLLETPVGLMLGPCNADTKDNASGLYVRATGHTEWKGRALPGKRCFYLQGDGPNPEKMRVYCDSKVYLSADGANTWTEKPAAPK